MDKIKHKLITNINMSLDSIESKLQIHEDLDCIEGSVKYSVTLKTTDFEIRLENYVKIKGENELKYYRNNELVKHIQNGNVVWDNTPNEELISSTKVDITNKISNISIIALDFLDFNERLIRKMNEKQMLIIKNFENSKNEINSKDPELEDQSEEEENSDGEVRKKTSELWTPIGRSYNDKEDGSDSNQTEHNRVKKESSGIVDNVSNIVDKGLKLFDTTTTPKDNRKDETNRRKENRAKKNSPLTFNEAMS